VIRRQIVIPVSAERLWDALTDPDQVAGWFGGRVEWELREGAPARFRGDDGTERLGRVEAVRPGRHLRFRWWPAVGAEPAGPAGATSPAGPDGPDGAGPAGSSEVSYLLEPDGEGTRLTVQERQLAAPDGPQTCARVGCSPTPRGWTGWDDRLFGAWAGLVAPATALVRT
jgi:uncharacterized protein YndB with AHSA1/START domain